MCVCVCFLSNATRYVSPVCVLCVPRRFLDRGVHVCEFGLCPNRSLCSEEFVEESTAEVQSGAEPLSYFT